MADTFSIGAGENLQNRRNLHANDAAGPIFVLKNMGYTDSQTVQVDPVQIVVTGADALL